MGRMFLGVVAAVFVCTFCAHAEDRPRNARQEANRVWYRQVQPRYRNSDTLCLRVSRLVPETQVQTTYLVGRTPKCFFYIGKHSSCYFDKKEMRYVDHHKRATYVVKRRSQQYKDWFVDYIVDEGGPFRHLYLTALRYSRVYTGMFDTVCDGKRYKVFLSPATNRHSYNNATQQFDLPNYTDDYFFCDADRLTVDSVSMVPQAVEGNTAFLTTFKLQSAFGCLPDSVAAEFDLGSPRYQFYTHYNEQNPPPEGEFIYCIRP